MPMKRYQPEQIVDLLRKVEVEIANGKKAAQAAREAGICEQPYYRWRKEFGGLKLDPTQRRDPNLLPGESSNRSEDLSGQKCHRQ